MVQDFFGDVRHLGSAWILRSLHVGFVQLLNKGFWNLGEVGGGELEVGFVGIIG